MKDSLFTDKFFSLSVINVNFSDDDKIQEQIIAKFYPNSGLAFYFPGKHNDEKAFFDFYHSENYQKTLIQIDIVLSNLHQWGQTHVISSAVFNDYFEKLKIPNPRLSILFSDGKKILEYISFALDDQSIELDKRKLVFLNLIENKQLSKCIDGCYTHLLNSFNEIKDYKESDFQLNHWTYSFVTNKAKEIMSKRPYAVSESYLKLVADLLSISLENNDIHVMNYFLKELKILGYPVFDYNDLYTDELTKKLTLFEDSSLIKKKFLEDFENEISVFNYVENIKTKMVGQINKIIKNTKMDFSNKVHAIQMNLNRIGLDPYFLYHEILDYDPLSFHNEDNLYITLVERLIQKGILKKPTDFWLIQDDKKFKYSSFNLNIELDWLYETKSNQARIRFVDLLSSSQDRVVNNQDKILYRLLFFKFNEIDVKTLNKLLKLKPEIIYYDFFIPSTHVLLKKNLDPVAFLKLISLLPKLKNQLILDLGPSYIKDLIQLGMKIADQHQLFKNLRLLHNRLSINEALMTTREIIKLTAPLAKLTHLQFKLIPKIDYINELDFSNYHLNDVTFYTKITNCLFTKSHLYKVFFENEVKSSEFIASELNLVKFNNIKSCVFTLSRFNEVYFQENMEAISLKQLNLKNTFFIAGKHYQDIDLFDTVLSEENFFALLTNKIQDFSHAYVQNANFENKLITTDKINFLYAHLEFSNFKNVDLTLSSLQGAYLNHCNLRGAHLVQGGFNSLTRISGAHLDFHNFIILYNSEIRNFQECHIYLNSLNSVFTFKHINLRNSIFYGENKFLISFQNSILNKVKFFGYDDERTLTLSEINFIETSIAYLRFQNLNINKITFKDCYNTYGISLKNVDVDPQFLFQLYQYGLFDFTEVHKVIGQLPGHLSIAPLKNAKLTKEVFLNLYKLGLKDFSFTNMQGFYLGEILLINKISETNLKLESVKTKSTYLTCMQRHRKRRNISACKIIFQIVNHLSKDTEIKFNTDHRSSLTVVRKIFLTQFSLWLLNDPSELILIWRYQPSKHDLDLIGNFLGFVTKQYQREDISLILNLDSYITNNEFRLNLASKINSLGFKKGEIKYKVESNEYKSIDFFGNNVIFREHKSVPIKNKAKLLKTELKNKLSTVTKLPIKVKNRAGRMVRMGIKQGAHYEIGESIIYLIGAAIANQQADTKQLSIAKKNQLIEYAERQVTYLSDQRGANQRQKRLTLNIVMQCIDRGECYNEETVLADMADSLKSMRPDLMIGNEVLWKHIKELFTGMGEFFVNSYQEINNFFVRKPELTAPTPPDLQIAGFQKDDSYLIDFEWFNYPIFIKLIQMVTEIYSKFDIDLHQNFEFDENDLINFFRDFSLALKGVSADLIATKLADPNFIKRFLDDYYANSTDSSLYLYFLNVTLENIITSEDFFQERQLYATQLPDTSIKTEITSQATNLSIIKREIFNNERMYHPLANAAPHPVSIINLASKGVLNYLPSTKISNEIILWVKKYNDRTITITIPISTFFTIGMTDAGLDYIIDRFRKGKHLSMVAFLILFKPIFFSLMKNCKDRLFDQSNSQLLFFSYFFNINLFLNIIFNVFPIFLFNLRNNSTHLKITYKILNLFIFALFFFKNNESINNTFLEKIYLFSIVNFFYSIFFSFGRCVTHYSFKYLFNFDNFSVKNLYQNKNIFFSNKSIKECKNNVKLDHLTNSSHENLDENVTSMYTPVESSSLTHSCML